MPLFFSFDKHFSKSSGPKGPTHHIGGPKGPTQANCTKKIPPMTDFGARKVDIRWNIDDISSMLYHQIVIRNHRFIGDLWTIWWLDWFVLYVQTVIFNGIEGKSIGAKKASDWSCIIYFRSNHLNWAYFSRHWWYSTLILIRAIRKHRIIILWLAWQQPFGLIRLKKRRALVLLLIHLNLGNNVH